MSETSWNYADFISWVNNPTLPHEHVNTLILSNNLTSLPPEIENLPNLTILGLSDN